MTSTANHCSNSSTDNDDVNRRVKKIEESLKKDNSQANIIAQFANVIEIEGVDKMACVIEIVNSMGKGWREIMKDEKELIGAIGHDQVLNLKHIRGEYFSLLLKTNIVIAGLLEQSKIQKENVEDAMEVVNKARTNGERQLSEADRLDYDESIQDLVKWIDQSELVAITQEWKLLMDKLQTQKSCIAEIAENLRAMAKSFEKSAKNAVKKVKKSTGFWSRCWGVITAVSSVIVLGAAICVNVLTLGAVAASAVSFALGTFVASGKSSASRCANIKPPMSENMRKRIVQITSMLDDYIHTCKVMQEKLSKMDSKLKELKTRATVTLNNKACKKIARGLKAIDTYLDEYIEQGTVLVSVIEESCAEFINN